MIASSPVRSRLSVHLSVSLSRSSCEEPGRSPQLWPLTCVTSACQCHQGASISRPGISLPVALRCTSPATALLPPPAPHPFHLSFLKASVTHLSFLSSTPGVILPSCTGPGKGGKGTIGAKMVTTFSLFQV